MEPQSASGLFNFLLREMPDAQMLHYFPSFHSPCIAYFGRQLPLPTTIDQLVRDQANPRLAKDDPREPFLAQKVEESKLYGVVMGYIPVVRKRSAIRMKMSSLENLSVLKEDVSDDYAVPQGSLPVNFWVGMRKRMLHRRKTLGENYLTFEEAFDAIGADPEVITRYGSAITWEKIASGHTRIAPSHDLSYFEAKMGELAPHDYKVDAIASNFGITIQILRGPERYTEGGLEANMRRWMETALAQFKTDIWVLKWRKVSNSRTGHKYHIKVMNFETRKDKSLPAQVLRIIAEAMNNKGSL